jgi:hypothetical protein
MGHHVTRAVQEELLDVQKSILVELRLLRSDLAAAGLPGGGHRQPAADAPGAQSATTAPPASGQASNILPQETDGSPGVAASDATRGGPETAAGGLPESSPADRRGRQPRASRDQQAHPQEGAGVPAELADIAPAAAGQVTTVPAAGVATTGNAPSRGAGQPTSARPPRDPLGQHVALWQLPFASYQDEHRRICAEHLDADRDRHLRHAGRLAGDPEFEGLLGQSWPELLLATCGLLAISRHTSGLRYIQPSAGLQDPFLDRREHHAYRDDLLQQCRLLVTGTTARQVDLLRVIDSMLRWVVPSDGVRILAPNRDSVWQGLLDLSLTAMTRLGEGLDPPVRYGHAPVGASYAEAKAHHHVGESQSRSLQPVTTGATRKVVWPVAAWYGTMSGGDTRLSAYAEVVYE